jgi:hypothetical protein
MAARGGGRIAPDGPLALRLSASSEVKDPPHAEPSPIAGASAGPGVSPRAGSGPLTFTRLKWTSFFHSVVYLSLIACALAGLGGPTLVLGWTHGILWILMSLACIAAVRKRVVPLRVAVAVAVLGGLGPFIGSYEFLREEHRRARLSSAAHR